jgi:hypothetical protein
VSWRPCRAVETPFTCSDFRCCEPAIASRFTITSAFISVEAGAYVARTKPEAVRYLMHVCC